MPNSLRMLSAPLATCSEESMHLTSCYQQRVVSAACLIAAALVFGSVCAAQTLVDQFAWMAKTDLPRVLGTVDHVLTDFDRDGDMDVVGLPGTPSRQRPARQRRAGGSAYRACRAPGTPTRVSRRATLTEMASST